MTTADTTPESPERTPTTAEVRMAYGDMYCRNPDDPAHSEGCPQDVDFDRWLAAHDAAVRADQIKKDAVIAKSRHDVGWEGHELMTARFPDDGRRIAAAIRAQLEGATDG